MAKSTPMTPKMTNGARQLPFVASMTATTTGVPTAPPSGVAAFATPTAVPSSRRGNQVFISFAVTVACGPSAAPKRIRMIRKLMKPTPAAVAAVKADQASAAQPMALRGPKRSAAQPPIRPKGA